MPIKDCSSDRCTTVYHMFAYNVQMNDVALCGYIGYLTHIGVMVLSVIFVN